MIQGPGTVSMEEWIDDLRSGRDRSFANHRRLPPPLFEGDRDYLSPQQQ